MAEVRSDQAASRSEQSSMRREIGDLRQMIQSLVPIGERTAVLVKQVEQMDEDVRRVEDKFDKRWDRLEGAQADARKEQAMSQPPLGPRAGGLRTIRIVLVLACVGIVANSIVVGALIGENAKRIRQVNEERAQNTIRNCEDVNRRHDNTIRALTGLYAIRIRDAPSAGDRERIRQSRTASVLLIEALTPKRDCVAFAREQVRELR
jgi:hypothetical protein